jgi:hypothetical protein
MLDTFDDEGDDEEDDGGGGKLSLFLSATS